MQMQSLCDSELIVLVTVCCANAAEIVNYRAKLREFYSYPEQLVFVDETSKDGRHAIRRYAWSERGKRAVVTLPFSRGKRLSIFAASDYKGDDSALNSQFCS